MSGWIKLHRSITGHWLYTEKRIFSKFEAWNDILLTVNYADAQCCIKGKVYDIKRGESILSFDSWGKRWGWDKSKVRRFLSLLKSENMIDLKSDNISTHLTVCKYDNYQDIRNTNEPQTKHKRNTNENQTTPIKEEEESKEEKELFSFEEFWNLYPQKVGKKKCEPKFNNLPEADKLKIKETLPNFISYKPFKDYIYPNPETYLNQARWDDGIPTLGLATVKTKEQENQEKLDWYRQQGF